MRLLTDFIKFFSKKITSYLKQHYVICIYIYFFLLPLDSNFFICSYLRSELADIDKYYYTILIMIVLYMIYLYIFNVNKDNIETTNYINIKYLFFLFKNQNATQIVYTYLNKLKTIFNNNNNYSILALVNIFKNIKKNMLL